MVMELNQEIGREGDDEAEFSHLEGVGESVKRIAAHTPDGVPPVIAATAVRDVCRARVALRSSPVNV